MQDTARRLKAIDIWLERLDHKNTTCGCGMCNLAEELKKEKQMLEKQLL